MISRTEAEHRFRLEMNRHHPITDAEWEQVQPCFHLLRLSKGAYFLRQGEVANQLGFVADGFLRCFHLDEEGNDITTHFIHQKLFAVDHNSFQHHIPSTENIIALEDTTLIILQREKVMEMLQNIPVWTKIQRSSLEEAYECMRSRSVKFQRLTGQERYESFLKESHPHIVQKANLGHIATYLGLKQETLSRIRKKQVQSSF
ncbi:MAG: Crp/Fnr family transcriptional regulator [Bacteroidota bacterium]